MTKFQQAAHWNTIFQLDFPLHITVWKFWPITEPYNRAPNSGFLFSCMWARLLTWVMKYTSQKLGFTHFPWFTAKAPKNTVRCQSRLKCYELWWTLMKKDLHSTCLFFFFTKFDLSTLFFRSNSLEIENVAVTMKSEQIQNKSKM